MLPFLISNDSLSNENSSPSNGFYRIRREHLNEYLNLLARQYVVTKQDRENYKKTSLMSESLIKLIKTEYNLK